METARPAHPELDGFMRTVTKVVRFRRRTKNGTATGIGLVSKDGNINGKATLPQHFDVASLPSHPDFFDEGEKQQQQQQELYHREAMESLLAKLFAGVSAIKATYAQLQFAQSPYNPETIQLADQEIVSELKQLSQLKQSYLRKQIQPSAWDSQLLAEMQEQRNHVKVFQITDKKMESDLHDKDEEILLMKHRLSESEKLNRCMEGKVHPERSLQVLDNLHLSALKPTHLLAVLRYTVKSIRSFTKLMVREMECAGWDLDAAAASIEGNVLCGKPKHRAFAFESFVCRTIFSDFHCHAFRLSDRVGGNSLPDRQRFFDEFAEMKSAKPKQDLNSNSESGFREFCRAKYLKMVHPRMEESLFGNLDHRALVASGDGFPETEFFANFAEMARRVWLLHRLFFSFGTEAGASIFQVRRGCRFSEVFMDSVVELESSECAPVVGFTVVPGFKVGKTVIQCKVYPATAGGRR